MRLVIEREGGFTVVDDADAITEIDVLNAEVRLTIEVGGDKWTVELPVRDHAEACRVSAAVAVKCGELVEPLSEQSEVDVEAAMGAASAALIRKNTKPRPVTLGEWVAGEPPRGGLWYVVTRAGAFGCVAWDGIRWRDWYSETVLMGSDVAHLPVPVPSRR